MMAHLSFTLMDYRWVDTKELKMNKRQKIKLLRNDPYSFFDIYGKDQAMSLASWCLLNRGASGERLFNRIEMIAFFYRRLLEISLSITSNIYRAPKI